MNALSKIALACVAPAVALMAQSANAATVYSETGPLDQPFFNNSNAVNKVANPTSSTVTLDNILIPNTILPPGIGLAVTRVTMQAVQSSNSNASTVQLYYASIATDTTPSNSATITPPTAVSNAVGGLQTVTANGNGVAFKPIVFENPANPGVAPLFTLTPGEINYTDDSPNGEFVLGYQFSDTTGGTSPDQGERLAFPDAGFSQTPEYFEYNLTNNSQAAFTFFAPNTADDGSGIYVIVEGTVLPEPASLGCLALGGILLSGRRRRSTVTA
jgi:hypothetical protein